MDVSSTDTASWSIGSTQSVNRSTLQTYYRTLLMWSRGMDHSLGLTLSRFVSCGRVCAFVPLGVHLCHSTSAANNVCTVQGTRSVPCCGDSDSDTVAQPVDHLRFSLHGQESHHVAHSVGMHCGAGGRCHCRNNRWWRGSRQG